jgi:hypothetical protein
MVPCAVRTGLLKLVTLSSNSYKILQNSVHIYKESYDIP